MRIQVEGFVIRWSHEVDEVLSMESQKDLEDGKNPGPDTEIKFWEMRFANLQNIHEQLTCKAARSMVNILVVTKSGYYVLFRSKINKLQSILDNYFLEICTEMSSSNYMKLRT